jgi:hypothetical protein
VTASTPKKLRVDRQLTGLAGEFFVAAELLKLGLQTSVTFGNAKAIDLFAYNPDSERSFTVQVKALRERNYFLIDSNRVSPHHTYVFVLLNSPNVPVQYFIVPGDVLFHGKEKFGKGYQCPKVPGIHPRELKEFENNWSAFLQ